MAPKKKARVASRAASTPSADAGDQAASSISSPAKLEVSSKPMVSDVWTDEQETSLLKSVIRWKPVGMHKHFRMIAISENLRNHGYTSPTDDHTRPPGVWKKLGDLYNLEVLDEREDGTPHSDPAQEPFCDFVLPDGDYSDRMFAKRLAKEGPSSPPIFAFQLSGAGSVREGRRHSTVDDSEEPRSSPASAKGYRGGRGRGSRPSKLAASSRPGRRGRASKGSVEPSAEEDNDNSVDVDEDAGKARRSGRKR